LRQVTRLLLLVLALLAPAAANAHEVRPALLQLTEGPAGTWTAFWKQPAVGDMALSLTPHLSSGWLETAPADQYAAPGYLVKVWTLRATAPLDGQTVTIQGLEGSITDALVEIEQADGRRASAVLTPQSPSLTLHLSGPAVLAMPAYLKLGIEHILTGVDHLLFVLGLLLLVGLNWRIVKTVTGFTVAHSITLTAAALGWIHVDAAVVEVLVALSIVFVAAELIPRRGGKETLTRRFPWVVAFVFGLLHGLAFAGGLAAVGLPHGAVAGALLLFNLGVEIGQLIFLAAAAGVILALRRVRASWPRREGAWVRSTAPYAIGVLSTFWFFERLAVAFQ
jgi:hydrogenase/urease accessory protein HupE